jgi:HSP90 family molecular chaperone
MLINSCKSGSDKSPSEITQLNEKLEFQTNDSNNKKYMTVEISDTGVGMTEEVQKQLNSSEEFVSEMHEMN